MSDERRVAEDMSGGLLMRSIESARSHGYARPFVEHETANIPGANFWGKQFTPFTCASVRTCTHPCEHFRIQVGQYVADLGVDVHQLHPRLVRSATLGRQARLGQGWIGFKGHGARRPAFLVSVRVIQSPLCGSGHLPTGNSAAQGSWYPARVPQVRSDRIA
jgi:hypothetical protein